MKVLDLSLRFLTFLGICSDELDRPTNEFLKTFRCIFFLVGNIYSIGIGSAVYLYYHLAELETATNALIVLTAAVASTTSFVTFGLKMKKVKLLYREIQAIADEGGCACDHLTLIF